jgi:hypothetical protein
MESVRDRQLHMVSLLKQWDRMVAEKHGKSGPIYHYQKPDALPGERDCVYIVAEKTYIPYGPDLEKQVNQARLWVRTGEGPRPQVIEHAERDVALSADQAAHELSPNKLSGGRRILITPAPNSPRGGTRNAPRS